jgi:hypothetical protein
LTKISDYLPLGQYLQKQALSGIDKVQLSFKEIEKLINKNYHQQQRKIKIGGQIQPQKSPGSVVLG